MNLVLVLDSKRQWYVQYISTVPVNSVVVHGQVPIELSCRIPYSYHFSPCLSSETYYTAAFFALSIQLHFPFRCVFRFRFRFRFRFLFHSLHGFSIRHWRLNGRLGGSRSFLLLGLFLLVLGSHLVHDGLDLHLSTQPIPFVWSSRRLFNRQDWVPMMRNVFLVRTLAWRNFWQS
jgi:hypothetical protein